MVVVTQSIVDWLDEQMISTRARHAIERSGITDPTDLRMKDAIFWLREPGCGRLTVAELARLIGFDPKPSRRDE